MWITAATSVGNHWTPSIFRFVHRVDLLSATLSVQPFQAVFEDANRTSGRLEGAGRAGLDPSGRGLLAPRRLQRAQGCGITSPGSKVSPTADRHRDCFWVVRRVYLLDGNVICWALATPMSRWDHRHEQVEAGGSIATW